MKIYVYTFIFLFFLLSISGCNKTPDYELLKSEILALHEATIQAHLEKDVDFFTKNISDNYFSVGRGEIRHPTKTEIKEMFSQYLSSTDFETYEDLQPPIIGYSKDGSMAWSIVKVNVAGSQQNQSDTLNRFDMIWTWITLYEKRNGIWIRLGEVSSSAP